MSSHSAASVQPRPTMRSRLLLLVREARSHDRSLAFSLALIVAAVAFEPRVRGGGFNADDWPEYVAVKFPHALGFNTALAALQHDAGSRIGHMLYWLVSFSVFGGHTRLYTATTAGLAVAMAFSLYLLLRELRFGLAPALAVMTLSIAAPSVEAVRMWFTPGGVQIALTLYFLGLTLALRAFAATPARRRRLHLWSFALYVASAVYVETALPLIAVSVLVYLTRATFAASVRRWALDMVVVVGGYGAALLFVSSSAGFEKLPSSMWGEHARLLGDQTLTVVTRSLGPVATADRMIGVLGLVAVAVASLVLLRRGALSDRRRREMVRWTLTFWISVAAIVAAYVVYVPAMLYYEPLGPGLATHINSVIAAPLAAGTVAVVMLTRLVVLEMLGRVPRRAVLVTSAVALAWFATIAGEAMEGVRHDGHIWALAAERGDHVLEVLHGHLRQPVAGATVYTFGEAGTVGPGMPIFFTSWEQTNAVKIRYDRPDVSSFPVVSEGIQVECAAKGVVPTVAGNALTAPSPYPLSYFFDVPTGKYRLLRGRRDCVSALSVFHAGPYVGPVVHEWWK